MSFELNEANRKIKQLEEQVSQKNEQLAEYREQINKLKKSRSIYQDRCEALESLCESYNIDTIEIEE